MCELSAATTEHFPEATAAESNIHPVATRKEKVTPYLTVQVLVTTQQSLAWHPTWRCYSQRSPEVKE